jgi:hypothetical protein
MTEARHHVLLQGELVGCASSGLASRFALLALAALASGTARPRTRPSWTACPASTISCAHADPPTPNNSA